MRFLFLKHSMEWPRTRGHDVHTYFLMNELGKMGHELNLLTIQPPPAAALAGLRTLNSVAGEVKPATHDGRGMLGPLQNRFRSYWGVLPEHLDATAAVVGRWSPNAVVAVGPEVLSYLAILTGVCRIWYVADDLCWQHLTQMKGFTADSWKSLGTALVNALYERTFGTAVDRVWVVSTIDARALGWISGAKRVDVIPNGVDMCYFRPTSQAELPNSAIFWGHLRFPPNVRAVEWFCQYVWPSVRRSRPTATLTIAGYGASDEILRFAETEGIQVVGEVADIRQEVTRHGLAIMPFRSSGGLKNKMLEAAAMGRATVCSRAALNGLRGPVEEAFAVANRPEEWATRMQKLWDDDRERGALGARARRWVETNHTWRSAAERAVASVLA